MPSLQFHINNLAPHYLMHLPSSALRKNKRYCPARQAKLYIYLVILYVMYKLNCDILNS